MTTTITQILGIDLHYARYTLEMVGTIGQPNTFQVEDQFLGELTDCFEELFNECPLGKPNVITSAGTYVNRPGTMHNQYRAFDLDAIFWDNYTLNSSDFHYDPVLYLGIDSFLRKHFVNVLNYFFDKPHEDHWHIDNDGTVDYRTDSEASTYYLQLISTHIYENPITIDGIFGPQTEGAINYILDLLNLSGQITNASTYKALLTKTGKIAFAKFEQKRIPPLLLDKVYQIVANSNLSSKDLHSINHGLDNFKNHQETIGFLNGEFDLASNLDELIEQVV